MTLSKQITKYIHPILKENGFSKVDHYWRRQDEEFYFAVEVGSSKHMQNQDAFRLVLGAFSVAIEELYCQRVPLEVSMSDMPCGVQLCHFASSFFQISDDLTKWDSNRGWVRIFDGGENVSSEFETIASRLRTLLPKFMETFSSVETIVTCKQQGMGAWTVSTQSKLQAAAGCIVLGRFDEAEAFITDGIKAGSAPLMREVSDRLRRKIEER